jgi:hypothetical protein
LLLLQIETFYQGQPLCTAIPGKLYSYLASGQRILAAVQQSESSELIERFQAGATVSPRSAADFASAIQAEYERWNPERLNRPDHRSILEFERPQLASRLANVFDSLLPQTW